MELAQFVEPEQAAHRDIFAAERRFEQRFPLTAQELPQFMQGYDRSPQSAAAILAFLERHWDLNSAMTHAIRGLLDIQTVTRGI